VGHTDPRLNLIVERGKDSVLRLTGATDGCVSRWPSGEVHDMVGNLDEWVADPSGVFVGGFYARATKEGCEARIASHSPLYYDYSLGTRCCRSAR
jgi:formylglycine-generating enzyme required for sulfatase activity